MTVLRILFLIVWLLAIPFCMGLLPLVLVPRDRRNAGVALLAGYFLMLPLFWLVTIPAMLFVTYDSFLVVVRVFTPLALLLAAAGVGVSLYAKKKGTWESLFSSLRPKNGKNLQNGKEWKKWKEIGVEETVEWALFFVLLAFQLYMAFTLTSFDGDDAEYVARSLIAQQSNVMYTILPYSGGTTTLDIRHALAVFPMWVAYIGRMSGVHSTIVAHSVLPLVFIPLTYTVYFEMGKRLFKKKKALLPAFLVLLSLLQIFGNVSIYTRETFFLTRTWQGKSLSANLVTLSVIWLLLMLFEKDGAKASAKVGTKAESVGTKAESAGTKAESAGTKAENAGAKAESARTKAESVCAEAGDAQERTKAAWFSRIISGWHDGKAGLWLLLFLVNMTAGIFTSQAALFCVILIGIVAFFMALYEKKFSILIKAGLVCIPNVAYMLLYLFLH